MKAAVLQSINADPPLKIMELENNRGLLRGQVLVKMLCTGLCGAQLQEIRGEKGDARYLPHLLGHEGCGIVIATGKHVTSVEPGQKVVMHWRKGRGLDTFGGFYHSMIGSGPITTFSEYSIVSENRVTPIPKDVPNDLGALFGCALSTALAVVENEARIKWGESVLIIGGGGMGLSLILAARCAYARPISVIESNTAKFRAISSMGAFPVASSRFNQEYPETYDAIIDTTGDSKMISEAAYLLNPGGRLILVGQSTKRIEISDLRSFVDECKTIKGTLAGGFNPSKDIPRYVNLARTGALDDYKKIIGHRLSLDQINDGIELMQKGQANGRVLIEFPL